MPILALFLSLLFSVTLIARDCRRRRSVSVAVWIPTILVMILGSRPASSWLSGGHIRTAVENANELQSSKVDEFFYLLVLGSSFLVATYRRIKWGKLITANTAIMLFYLYFAISVLWSSDPSGSTKRLVKDFGLLFVIGIILAEKNPLDAMRAVYVRCAFLLLPLSIVFIKYFPSYGRSYGLGGEMLFTGVTTQKNSLGELVLISTLFLIWDYVESRPAGAKFRLNKVSWELVVLLVIGAWLLRISQSKTSMVCLVIGIFLLVRRGRLMSKSLSRIAMAGALSLPFLVLYSIQFSEVIAPVLQAMGRNATFTGRTNIWEHITPQTVNPIIGAGYWNFWGGPGGYAINQAMRSLIPNAHNGYLDMYLDGGIIGITMLFLMLITCGLRITKHLRFGGDVNHYHRMRFAVLMVMIIYNLSETAFARMSLIWFTTLLMMVDYLPIKAAAVKVRKTLDQRRNSNVIYGAPTLLNQ